MSHPLEIAMDTGGDGETPMDTTLTQEGTAQWEAQDGQLPTSEPSREETDAVEDVKLREVSDNLDPSGSGVSLHEEASAALAPSLSSLSSVFATPSASLHAVTTASGTSTSPSSSMGELRKEESTSPSSPSTRAALPSLPPPVPTSLAFSSLSTTKSTITSSSTGTFPSNGATSPSSTALAMSIMEEESTSRSQPFHPLPDVMTALNMRPASQGSKSDGSSSMSMGSSGGEGSSAGKVESLGPGSKDVLIDKFKRDPNGVLNLLQSALNMDKLSGLLKHEHLKDSEVLPQLQNRLEAAYHTLRECQENKEMLGEKISETRLKIGDKRKHLEELRGELKILGDEELKLKKQRDISHTKYSELKRRLQCSTEALQQIAQLTKSSHSVSSSNSSSSSQRAAGAGPNSKVVDGLSSGIST